MIMELKYANIGYETTYVEFFLNNTRMWDQIINLYNNDKIYMSQDLMLYINVMAVAFILNEANVLHNEIQRH